MKYLKNGEEAVVGVKWDGSAEALREIIGTCPFSRCGMCRAEISKTGTLVIAMRNDDGGPVFLGAELGDYVVIDGCDVEAYSWPEFREMFEACDDSQDDERLASEDELSPEERKSIRSSIEDAVRAMFGDSQEFIKVVKECGRRPRVVALGLDRPVTIGWL